MTFPLNSSKDYGSVRNIEVILEKTGARDTHASTLILHSGQQKQLKTRNAVSPDMSREITGIYGKHVPVGSRKFKELL